MPIETPVLDRRRFQDLYEELLARVPVHTREWTNLNPGDPGVTLLQLFAWLTESMLYRANQVPERNRRKFLQLLGVPLSPASPASGLVTFTNEGGLLQTVTLSAGVEVRAGQMPFRTLHGLDVLPLEAKAYFKRRLPQQPGAERQLYEQLYESFRNDTAGDELELYELTPLESRSATGVDLGAEAVDRSLWIALMARPRDPIPQAADPLAAIRDVIQRRTLSLGVVPQLDFADAQRRLTPGGSGRSAGNRVIEIQLPNVAGNRLLPPDRQPTYRTLQTMALPTEPTVMEIPLPERAQLFLWEDLDPLEGGTDLFPPALDDTAQQERVITWLRLLWPEGVPARLMWAGFNVARVTQREHIANEVLPAGTGEPDQTHKVAKPPVVAGSVEVTVTADTITAAGTTIPEEVRWDAINDLLGAGPEVPTEDYDVPPGTSPPPARPSKVFAVDAEAGRIDFGDGLRGVRPPINATIRVSYDHSLGRAGNVSAGSINASPTLPEGFKVTNPVRTWGGADVEAVSEGEKQVARVLQHRERLVTTSDFETITLRTPGVDVGRVEVLPAYNPLMARDEPGNAPGTVTLMLIPRYSATRPDAPSPSPDFLRSVCAHLEPRRLITTELYLRGPEYVGVWITVGIEVVAGFDTPTIRDAVAARLRDFLAPLRTDDASPLEDQALLLSTPSAIGTLRGWALRRPVLAKELEAEVARVTGVALINQLFLALGTGAAVDRIEMRGLQLPRVDGIAVAEGDALSLAQLRGDSTAAPGGPGLTKPRRVPVPAVPKDC